MMKKNHCMLFLNSCSCRGEPKLGKDLLNVHNENKRWNYCHKKELKTHIMIPVDLAIQLLCLGAGSWHVGRLLLVSLQTDGQDLLIWLTTTPSFLLPLYSSLYHNMQFYISLLICLRAEFSIFRSSFTCSRKFLFLNLFLFSFYQWEATMKILVHSCYFLCSQNITGHFWHI